MSQLSSGYLTFLTELKQRIRSARIRAAVSVNRELILLYWGIGRDILARQQSEGWGAKVITRLAADLRRAFPEMSGLSVRNLKYMRSLAQAWPDEELVQQVVAQLPWGHNTHLLYAVKSAPNVNGMPAKPSTMAGAATCWLIKSTVACSPDKAEQSPISHALCQPHSRNWRSSSAKIRTALISSRCGRICWSEICSVA